MSMLQSSKLRPTIAGRPKSTSNAFEKLRRLNRDRRGKPAHRSLQHEPLPYDYAIVANYGRGDARSFQLMVDILERLLAAGIQVSVMESTPTSEHKIVLLVRPTAERLAAERNQLKIDRYFAQGAIGEPPAELHPDWTPRMLHCVDCLELPGEPKIVGVEDYGRGGLVCPNCDRVLLAETPAERIQLIGTILERSHHGQPKGVGLHLHRCVAATSLPRRCHVAATSLPRRCRVAAASLPRH